MAIALDTSTAVSVTGSGTSLTYAHTASGTNRILFVPCASINGSHTITGVTYNGVAMTEIGHAATQGNFFTYLWCLIAPDTGTNNVVITAGGTNKIAGGAVSYTGALQSGQPDSFNTGTAVGTSLTVSTTVVASGSWMVGIGNTGNGTIAAGTGMTARQTRNGDASFDSFIFGDSNGTVSTGSQSMNFTNGGADSMGMVLASFAPVPATTNGNFLSFM